MRNATLPYRFLTLTYIAIPHHHYHFTRLDPDPSADLFVGKLACRRKAVMHHILVEGINYLMFALRLAKRVITA